MRKLILMLITTSIGLAACSKKEPCEQNKTFTLRITNNTNNSYKVYINGNYIKKQSGNTFFEQSMQEGTHYINVEQSSGIIITPRKKEYTITQVRCKQSEIIY